MGRLPLNTQARQRASYAAAILIAPASSHAAQCPVAAIRAMHTSHPAIPPSFTMRQILVHTRTSIHPSIHPTYVGKRPQPPPLSLSRMPAGRVVRAVAHEPTRPPSHPVCAMIPSPIRASPGPGLPWENALYPLSHPCRLRVTVTRFRHETPVRRLGGPAAGRRPRGPCHHCCHVLQRHAAWPYRSG